METESLEFLEEIFSGNRKHCEEIKDEIENHQDGQDPNIVSITCSDSRVIQGDIWNNKDLGKEFTKEVIGNHVNVYTSEGETVISGSVDYIPLHSDTRTIIAVIGHTGCGAVTAAYKTLKRIQEDKELNEKELKEINGKSIGINSDISLIIEAGLTEDFVEIEETSEKMYINKLVERNVDNQIEFLCENTSYDKVDFVGLVYDMDGTYGPKGKLYLVNLNNRKAVDEIEKEISDGRIEVKRLS